MLFKTPKGKIIFKNQQQKFSQVSASYLLFPQSIYSSHRILQFSYFFDNVCSWGMEKVNAYFCTNDYFWVSLATLLCILIIISYYFTGSFVLAVEVNMEFTIHFLI